MKIEMPQVVVCDTNIWYGPSKERATVLDCRFVGTFVNFFELAQSPNWFEKTERARSAAVALFRDASEFRMDNPWARIAGVSGLSFIAASDYSAEDRFKFLHHMAHGAQFTEAGALLLKSKIDERKEGLSLLAADLGKATGLMREMGKRFNVSSKRIEMDVVRSVLAELISRWAGAPVNPSAVNWSEVQLFMGALHEYVFGKVSAKSSPPGNDLCDLLNLLYVRPGEQYWTNESYWNQVIQRAGLGAYLFGPSPK